MSDFPCHDEFLQMFRRYVKHDYDDYSPAEIEILTKMMALFPKVAFWIKQEQRLSTWLKFFELVASGKYPPNAYALWMDTIEYITSENVHGMLYSGDKRFVDTRIQNVQGKVCKIHGWLQK